MRVYDSTLTIPGAVQAWIPWVGHWCDGRSIDFDRIKRFAAEIVPASVEYLAMDLEVPALMELRAHIFGVNAVKPGIELAIKILNTVRAERPRLKLTFYDAFIEDFTTAHKAMEARIRMISPRGDGYDDHFIGGAPKAFADLARIEWANDVIADVHDACDWVGARAYFAFSADAPWKREGIMQWACGEGHRIAKGRPAPLTYKPNRQDKTRRVEHTDADMAADFAFMSKIGVPAINFWADDKTPKASLLKCSILASKAAIVMAPPAVPTT